MFKKILITSALIVVIGALVFGAINRTAAKTENGSAETAQGGYGHGASQNLSTDLTSDASLTTQGNGGYGQGAGSHNESQLANQYAATPGELSAEEAAALIYMREEEKLAHDVYATLYAQWSLPLFQNISQSEQTHSDAVKALLDRYGLSDPAVNEIGVFTDPDLQALYNDLIARGGQSLAEALKVGAAIEEIDILDLQSHLAQADNRDILQVFNSLMNGSYSHLRAFVSTLQNQTGEIYQPQYLSADAYQTILSASSGASGNSKGGGGNGQGASGMGAAGLGSNGQGASGMGSNGQGGNRQGGNQAQQP